MGKSKLDEQDKKMVAIFLILNAVLSFLLEGGINIAALLFYTYLNHKYIKTTKCIEDYSHYTFEDEEKFNKGKEIASIVLDIYVIIRMISLIIRPQYFYIIVELLIITLAYGLYEKYLEKRYVISRYSDKTLN